MPSRTDRIEFSPPQEPGNLRAFGLALLIHALLIAALTWGVNWKSADKSVTYDAEIWSNIAQQVAPREILAPTPPAPKLPPVPEVATPAPAPPPPPPPPAPIVKVAPPEPVVDIALEQEKKRKELAKQKELEAQKLAALKAKQAEVKAEEQARKDAKLEAEKLAQAKKEKALQLKQEQAKKEAEKKEAEKKLAEKKAAEQKVAQQQAEKEKEKQAQAVREKQRQDNLDRMKTQAGVAGANGSAADTGTALKSAGPSASYGGKVRARIRPNIVFSDQLTDNPMSSVEVRSLPDGNIISQRLVKSSGNAAWDDAVVRAIIRMGSMPLDTNGRAPGVVILDLSPKDK